MVVVGVPKILEEVVGVPKIEEVAAVVVVVVAATAAWAKILVVDVVGVENMLLVVGVPKIEVL